MTLEIRLWQKVKKTEGCWLWTAGVDKDGYGLLRNEVGITERVPRLVWKLTKGAIPYDLHVLHTCDSPACCRPEHLYLGTHAANMADMVQKGRANRPEGSKNGRARLTEWTVAYIRQEYARGGITQGELARKYNASRGAVCHALSGYTWA